MPAKDFDAGMRELGDRVGRGELRGVCEFDQIYAAA